MRQGAGPRVPVETGRLDAAFVESNGRSPPSRVARRPRGGRVAIAGFAGIIAAIETDDSVHVRQEIRALVVGAVSVVLGSLLPLLLYAAPIDVTSVWRIASGVVLASLLAYYVVTPREAFRAVRVSGWYPVSVSGDIEPRRSS